MRRIWGVGALALLAALVPVQAVQARDDDHLPDQIDLPNGWQPEGITTDGRSLFVGSLADGAIWRANPRTGKGEVLAPGRTGRVAAGVEYDVRRDVLWVAGGPTSQIRAHDADTGKVLRIYRFPSSTGRFLNDLVVTRRGVFATDSMNQELAVVPFESAGDHEDSLPPRSTATTLPLTGDLVYVEGFNLNGIVRSQGWLLAVQSNTGLLFRINQRTGVTHEVDLGGASLTNGDGLEIDDETLYVVRNQDNLVAVVELGDDLESGALVDEITNPGFDVPTTAALARDALWVVNARFGTTPTPETPYWITRVDEYDD
jgi:sugar lactone lactonase YvrE